VTCYFTAENIATLNKAKDDAHAKFEALRNKLVARTYKSNRGREYAVNGLIRRLDTMIRAIDYVYNILPLEQEDIPDADDHIGATILIQSFVTNLHGCLDKSDEYQRLQTEAYEAGLKGDYKAYDELTSKQKALGVYRPWMMHSSAEKSPGVVFHEQLLQDFTTIDECANKILQELALFDKNPKVENLGVVRRLLSRGLQAIRDLIGLRTD
jgi:hypothetical protein